MKSDTRSVYDMSFILPQLTRIASFAMYATEAETTAEALERIADLARELVGARYAALGVPSASGRLRHFRFSGIDPETVERIGALPEGRGLLGAIIKELKPIRLDSIQDDPRSVGFPEHHPHMSRFLGVPIIVGQNLYGMLYLTDKQDGEPFTDEDEQVVEVIAGYAALVISGAQLRDRERRVARLEERERISMELHDGVIQSLYAIGMSLELIRSSGTPSGEDIVEVMRNLDNVVTDIRRYIRDLKVAADDSRTLGGCLRDLLKRLHIPPSLDVTLIGADDVVRLPDVVYETVCQMANEVISNVVRHANARNLRIITSLEARQLTILFEDDGMGFDVDAMTSSGGLGLRNLKKRAQLNRGQIEIASAPGRGTRILLRLPT